MLVEFSVGNFRSFKERVTLSLEAAEIASQPPSLDTRNVFTVDDELCLLTSAAIYGANASGKSNLIKALGFMRNLVLSSSRETQAGELIDVEPYRLSTVTEQQPSEFEIVFLLDGTQYRYGFTVRTERIVSEWLYQQGSAREITLFSRTTDSIKINMRTFREGRGLEERTRPNALFLSVVAQFNGTIAVNIVRWHESLVIGAGPADLADMLNAIQRFELPAYQNAIVDLIKRLDVGIDGIEIERLPTTPSGSSIALVLKTLHSKRNAADVVVSYEALNMLEHESAGTQRLFALAYPLLHALRDGGVLVIDELDARIHPNLVIELIRLFQDSATNPHHAQLIFTTHNTSLLRAKLFRRDQVWFVEKSRQGASDLYSLVEYRVDGKIVRNDASFEKDYVAGRYGAVPFISDLAELLGAEHEPTTSR
jgi:AAA15 family ATPase/GTPase